MAKKQQIVLPSLTKSTEKKLEYFSLITKLEKHNVDLLNKHGYNIGQVVKDVVYRLLPKTMFKPWLLYSFIFLQDLIKGRPFNSDRYAYYLLFLKEVYGMDLNKKQLQSFNEYFDKSKNLSFTYAGKQDVVGRENNTSLEEFVNSKPKKIILLSSDSVGVGKTTTCNKIVEKLEKSERVAFAGFIREHLSFIFQLSGIDSKYFEEPLYSKIKNKATLVDEGYEPIVLRDLICDYSDLIQKHFGKTYWATSMYDYVLDSNSDYILVDDLRRPIELEYLKHNYGEENILTVFLTKENKESVQLSETSSNYEGQLDPSSFDINFTFNSDWSNTDELISIIKSKLI